MAIDRLAPARHPTTEGRGCHSAHQVGRDLEPSCRLSLCALRPAALAVTGIGGTAEAADTLSEAAPSALSS